MTTIRPVSSDRPLVSGFREGDEVVLSDGAYRGTLGRFLRLKKDVNWADITERNGSIRSHPVAWLTYSTAATPGFDAEGVQTIRT